MRPNNPNKRLRGRNRSKNSNPLARSYESNGPDVKIRGSALQVADKYAQLARDAQSSGDRVMAENYFQHAEHYYRIVAQAYEQANGQQPRERRDEHGREDGNGRYDDRSFANEQPAVNGYDAVDEEDGLRRALRANGAERADRPERSGHAERGASGNGSGDQPRTEDGASGEAEHDRAPSTDTGAAAADGDGDDEAKPKRRTRSPRPRSRTRRSESGEDAAAEPTEPAT